MTAAKTTIAPLFKEIIDLLIEAANGSTEVIAILLIAVATLVVTTRKVNIRAVTTHKEITVINTEEKNSLVTHNGKSGNDIDMVKSTT